MDYDIGVNKESTRKPLSKHLEIFHPWGKVMSAGNQVLYSLLMLATNFDIGSGSVCQNLNAFHVGECTHFEHRRYGVLVLPSLL